MNHALSSREVVSLAKDEGKKNISLVKGSIATTIRLPFHLNQCLQLGYKCEEHHKLNPNKKFFIQLLFQLQDIVVYQINGIH